MESILKRKSIRSFKDTAVSEENIKDLLHAGMSAPTAGNARAWKFIVVTDKKVLDQLPMDEYTVAVKEAPLAIVVCGDKSKEVYENCNALDCSAAIENILITAVDKGLAAVWFCGAPFAHRIDHLKKLLGLPEEIVPYGVLPIGYNDEKLEVQNRFDASMVHYDRW